MNERTKLILALNQIENITALTSDNEYKSYLISHLIPIQTELSRQLTNLTRSIKIKES